MDIVRSSSFRVPGRVSKKLKHNPSTISAMPKPVFPATNSTTAMPLKAQGWRGSVGKQRDFTYINSYIIILLFYYIKLNCFFDFNGSK